MHSFQRVIAITLIVCLMPTLCGDWITSLRAATPPNPTLAKQQVELLGVGAGVKVRLASGEKLEGAVASFDARGFDLIPRRQGSPRRIAYDRVTELKLAKSTYRASGHPDTLQVRRVVAGLGVGKHVAAKVTSGKKFRGHIQAINEDHFVLLPDRKAASVEIAYGDVQQLGPNLSKGAKIALFVIVLTATVVLLVLFGEEVTEESAESDEDIFEAFYAQRCPLQAG